MTIDERLKKLVERQEALAQSMELYVQITKGDMAKIRQTLTTILEAVQGLQRIAMAHELRVTRLEDRQ